MKPKNTEIIQAQATEIAPIQDEATALISQAINKGVDVATMEKLLAMRRELKQERAKEEYDRAMAAFQSECPTIQKTKEVRTKAGIVAYRYAPIESIVDQVKNALRNNGFSYSTSMDLLENGVKVCVKVTHAAGHSEETCMTVPLGNKTEIMSQTQVVAAAQTFAKRYAFCNAFGILTGDEDNDGDTKSLGSEKPLPSSPLPSTKLASKPMEITNDQKTDVMVLLGKKGKTMDDMASAIKTAFDKTYLKELTWQEADALITRLKRLPDFKEDTGAVGHFESPDLTEEELDKVSEGIEQQKLEE